MNVSKRAVALMVSGLLLSAGLVLAACGVAADDGRPANCATEQDDDD